MEGLLVEQQKKMRRIRIYGFSMAVERKSFPFSSSSTTPR
jgi:hypothetical protein